MQAHLLECVCARLMGEGWITWIMPDNEGLGLRIWLQPTPLVLLSACIPTRPVARGKFLMNVMDSDDEVQFW